MWLDPEDPRPKRAVHIVWANEITREGDPLPAPDIEPTHVSESHPYPRVGFEEILRMKLLAWRDHDRAHLRDMVHIGLLRPEMLDRFDGVLRERLQFIFDNPETSLG
ncbi:MAG: hypothetical protein ACO3P9_12650 [Phycisphaerales bacterium]